MAASNSPRAIESSLVSLLVIDFEAILIDGAFPEAIRLDLVERVRRYVTNQDTRGLIAPQIEAGSIGRKARAIGAATRPDRRTVHAVLMHSLGTDRSPDQGR